MKMTENGNGNPRFGPTFRWNLANKSKKFKRIAAISLTSVLLQEGDGTCAVNAGMELENIIGGEAAPKMSVTQ